MVNPDDLPPPNLPNLGQEIWRTRGMLREVQARLAFNNADPDGQLTRTAQMLALKRGSRR